MSGSCKDCGNVMCICDKSKPNNKFKVGQWVVARDVVFKIDDIKVYGETFGYSNHEIDGYFTQKDLVLANTALLLELFKHHKEMGILS